MKRLDAHHLEHAPVDSAALPVPGRGESVPVKPVVLRERIQQRNATVIGRWSAPSRAEQ
jgi:hypothetical protein